MKYFSVCVLALFTSACGHFQTSSSDHYSPSATEPDAIELTPPEEALASQPEPAQEDTAPELAAAPEESRDLWIRVRDNFMLDETVEDPRIASQLRWYASHQSYLNRVSERGERYLHYIITQIEERNMPGELALLPIVESAFDPFAYSHGRASGVWQFIQSTGAAYGLKQDWWQDGRRDIRAATDAALTYLDRLQAQFDGDWMLALASYNSGAGTVRKAIRRNREKGLPTDFWALDLPRETRAYVPKLIALAKLLLDPEAHGIVWPELPDEPYFAVVETGGQIDLAQVAELSGADLDEIYRLNPGFNRWATHPAGPHEVLVPLNNADTFAENLKSLPPEHRVRWQRYTVRSGDSLNLIAKRFQTTPDALQIANDLNSSVIYAGQQLMIPSAHKSQGEYTLSLAKRTEKLQTRKPSGSSSRVDYYVRAGDSFWEIAQEYDVSVRELARWNAMAPTDPLRIGQKLVIWSKNRSANREVIRKVHYQVRKGDSLAAIADRFNVSLKDIRRWNVAEVASKYLQPGQNLTLYVNVTR